MITAIDTSVLIAISKQEADGDAWIGLLSDARGAGSLVVCDVVVAEFYASSMSEIYVRRFLEDLDISYAETSQKAAFLAGEIFRKYRDKGGPRQHLIPDFLIAAHAQVDCDRLAAADRGYLRTWFPKLPLLDEHTK